MSVDWSYGEEVDGDRAGAIVGGYRLLRQIGRGGMGRVFLARDELAQRDVALKLLDLRGSANLERFRREGELAGRLDHPGIVRVHAAGTDDAEHFLVYELVEDAQTLDAAWKGADLRTRVGWVRDAARALGYAHTQGVVHRDVKPDNLLIDSAGALKVADFGIAGAADLERLTRTGAMVGTPTHMAPEQLRGERVTPATDVWALGVVLYQALCDELPFASDTWPALVTEVTERSPDLPSSVAKGVPQALDRLCLLALARAAGQRPANGEVFAKALDEWLAGHTPGLLRAATGRRRRAFALALGGLATLAAAAGAGVWARAQGNAQAQTPTPAAPAPSQAGAEVQAVSAAELRERLRSSKQGVERLGAIRAAERWLERGAAREAKGERELRIQLDRIVREPIAEIRPDTPSKRRQPSSVTAWGERLLVRAGAQAAPWDTASFLRAGPWFTLRGKLYVRDLERAWIVHKASRTLVTFDAKGGPPIGGPKTAAVFGRRLLTLSYSPARDRLAESRAKSRISWGPADGKLLRELALDLPAVNLRFSPSGDFLAASCAGRRDRDPNTSLAELRIWQLGPPTRQVAGTLLDSYATALTWLNDQTLFVGQKLGGLIRFETSSKTLNHLLRGRQPEGRVERLVPRPGGLVLACGRRGILAFDHELGKTVFVLNYPLPDVEATSFGLHKDLLWVGTQGGRVYVYSANLARYAKR